MRARLRDGRVASLFEKLSLGLLLVTFFLVPMTTLRVAGVAIGDFFVMGLICLAPVSLFIFGLPRKAVPKWMWVSAGLFAGSLLLTLVFPFDYEPDLYERLTATADPYSSSPVIWARLVFAVLVFPLIVAVLVRNWAQLKWLAGAWISGVAVSSSIAVLDAGLGTTVQETLSYDAFIVRGLMGVWADVTEYQRYVGLTEHPNTLGITAAMAAPVLICWLGSRRQLLFFIPAFFFLLAGVFLSGSRSALVGFLAAGVAVAYMYRRQILSLLRTFFAGRRGTYRLVAVVVVSLVALAGVAGYVVSKGSIGPIADSVTLERIFDSDTAKVSNDERSSSLEAGLDAVAANPVTGSGFIWVEAPHNIVLGLLMSGGILALVAFAWAIVGYLRIGIKLKRTVPPGTARLVVGCIASLVAYVVMSPLINQSFNRYLYLPAALLLAAWVLLSREDRVDEQAETATPPPPVS